MNLKKLYLLIAAVLLVIGLFLTYNFYAIIYKPNTVKEGSLYIPTHSNFTDVETLVTPYLKRVKPFIWVAEMKKYVNAVKPGKYNILKGMNNNELVNLLRSGKQTPVNLSFNNQESLEKLAGRIAVQIEADSISLINSFTDTDFIEKSGFTNATAIAMYIPNSYEFYWNTSATSFRNRMLKEYHSFWNENRILKANKLQLSEIEVITLASIVQKETSKISERPIVAKLYLNRLQNGWPLQADPTVIFALKIADERAVIKRVLKKDLAIDSPYNTYKYVGLPPGPITMPDISSIDAVLNPAQHNYFYMCASTTEIGSHKFSNSLKEHLKNAAKYQAWISKQGINR